MADLNPSQRATLATNIQETFGVEVDGETLAFEVAGVAVSIGPDRTITLEKDGLSKTLSGDDFGGRGFTGTMVGAISLAVRELVSEVAIAVKKSKGRRAIHGGREFISR